jgi:hypothetical protein
MVNLYGQDRSQWFRFHFPWNDSSKSVTDFSTLLDPPAGKYGFLKVTGNGHLKFENSNSPVRFVGVANTAMANFPDKAMAPALAARIAKIGFNFIRIHLFDVAGVNGLFKNSQINTSELDEIRLDKLDYFIKCLRDKGIYYNFCVQSGRVFQLGDTIDAPIENGQSKYSTLFNPRLIELEKVFAKKILTHLNPYTGLIYRDDPALITMELTNENSLFNGWFGWNQDYIFGDTPLGIGTYYSQELDSLFNEWLTNKYESEDSLKTAWNNHESQGAELVENNSFETGITPWRTYINTGAGVNATIAVATEEAYGGTHSMKVVVTTPGQQNWHVQIKTNNFSIEKNTGYKGFFYMKADNENSIAVEILKDVVWTGYGYFNFQADTVWKKYEFNFTSLEDVQNSVLAQFDLGLAVGTYWIDSVSIIKFAGIGLDTNESLALRNISRTKNSEFSKYSTQRVGDNAAFYFDIEGKYIDTMTNYLRKVLGVKCPISFTNNYFGLASIYSQSRTDYMDTHFYWDHPNFPNGWSTTNFNMNNQAMVKDPYNSTINKISLCKVQNKPLFLTEYNHPYPYIYQSEAPPLIYAYGSFFNLDAICFYTYYDFHQDYDRAYQIPFFDIGTNPIMLAQLPLSIAYRYGYIDSAKEIITANYKQSDVFDQTRFYKDQYLINISGQRNTTSFLEHGFAHALFDTDSTYLTSSLNDPGKVILSDTKELEWNGETGIVSINNTRWQGLVGFVAGKTEDLDFLKVDNVFTTDNRGFASINLISLDTLPLTQSKRMLLITTARLENKGQLWNQKETALTQAGGEYSICEPVFGMIDFKNAILDSFAVYQLDEKGQRKVSVLTNIDNEPGKFNLTGKTLWYEITNHDTVQVILSVPPLEENAIKVDYEIYPNPAANEAQLRVEGLTGTSDEFYIYSLTGEIVYKKILIPDNASQLTGMSIDLSDIKPGVYYCVMIMSNNICSGIKKLVVIK